ncbi:MAG TPA: M48 family metallopeptidase [Planctomycetota bacterium]|nr:M48 family metallopeptidase [Planctomycetota bacterium]
MRIPFDLIAALVCVEGIRHFSYEHAGAHLSDPTLTQVLTLWGGFLLICWLSSEWVVRDAEWRTRFGMLPSGHKSRRHPLEILGWTTHAAQALTVLVFAAVVWLLRWPQLTLNWPAWIGLDPNVSIGRLYLAESALASIPLNAGPFLLGMIAGWIPRRRLAAGIRGRPIPLLSFVGFEARLTWIPVALSMFQALVRDVSEILPEHFTAWTAEPGMDIILMLGTMLFVSAYALPKLVIWLWQCRPLPDGELKQRLVALLNRSGVKTRDILTWGPRGSNLLNACVLGMWPRYRFVLISPALAEELTLEETEAVLAHELGHARHGHLTLLFVMLLALLALLGIVLLAFDSPIAQIAAVLIFLVVYIRFVFGAIMRQCEREADLASAELMGTPVPLVTALEKLAIITGNIRNVWSWHHGSMAERVNAVMSLSSDPAGSYFFHRRLRRFRIAFTVTTLAVLGAEIFSKLV